MIAERIRTSISEGARLQSKQVQEQEWRVPANTCVVILDDDPTGTQTVHGVPVITEWSESILKDMVTKHPVFFILTNSRSLQADEAYELNRLLGKRLGSICNSLEKRLIPVSRSDSTLRGHYPGEVNALMEGLGWQRAKHVIAPAFFEGGRYTFENMHYVQEGEHFVPAAETPFAKDKTFGYLHSNLKKWVEEKTNGSIQSYAVKSISIKTIREKGHEGILQVLQERSNVVVVNATSLYDLTQVALTCILSKENIIYRTAASFINALTGIRPKYLDIKEELKQKHHTNGGLTVIGSYVPKTTAQLNHLKNHNKSSRFLEFKVADVFDNMGFENQITNLTEKLSSSIKSGKDVVLYTSRELISGTSKEESLNIVNKVSEGLVQIVERLTTRPRFLIAKGGITSSDIAVKALKVQQATVLGQALKGIPVWSLGQDSTYPGMPYIIFPGNVGGEEALYELIEKLSQ